MTTLTRVTIPIARKLDQLTGYALKQAEGTLAILSDELSIALTTLEGQTGTITTDLTTVTNDVQAVELDVAAVETDVAAVETNVAGHTTQINTITARIPTPLANHVDDAAAAAGGIAVGQFYRTASAVKIRVA